MKPERSTLFVAIAFCLYWISNLVEVNCSHDLEKAAPVREALWIPALIVVIFSCYSSLFVSIKVALHLGANVVRNHTNLLRAGVRDIAGAFLVLAIIIHNLQNIIPYILSGSRTFYFAPKVPPFLPAFVVGMLASLAYMAVGIRSRSVKPEVHPREPAGPLPK